MRVVRLDITLVEVPMRPPVGPYTSRYRTSTTTCSGIVRVEDDQGNEGWGEFNTNFLPNLDAQRMCHQAWQWLEHLGEFSLEQFHQGCPLEVRLRSGVEMALVELWARRLGVPVAHLLGGPVRTQVPVAACMGICSAEQAEQTARFYTQQGFQVLKIKAGRRIEEDVAMVEAITRGSQGRLRIRVDPNCGYSYEQAVQLAQALTPFPIEYLEQPLPEEALDQSAQLRQAISIPVALNESVWGPESAWEILRCGAADVLVVETYQAGGVLPCVKIAHMAQAAGVSCVMHCGHDLGIKTACMVHLGVACPGFDMAHDTTYYGLQDITRRRLPIHQGHIRLPSGPGWGVEVDPELLTKFQLATASRCKRD